jgi:hypothetical protein
MTPLHVRGQVLSPEGKPLQGVLVMGLDLNYSETDAEGRFSLTRPEMALFCWYTGYRPTTRLLERDAAEVRIIMSPVVAAPAKKAAGAGQ